MKQEIELELKNIITEEEFIKVTKKFSLTNKDFVKQENHYFDTKEFALKQIGSALRIREKNNQYTLTLKQPYNDGLLESHEKLSEEEANEIIYQNKPISGEIANIINEKGIKPSKLFFLGSLTTYRAELKFENGLLVFDHSVYLNHEDYELEYEVNDLKEGNLSFQNLLHQLNIPKRDTKNKIVRFFLAKQQSK
jgi:uncharacterized protein YjbK